MEFASFEAFREYMESTVSDYNTKRPHSSLNYMTPEEFESVIANEDFRKKWIEKEIRNTIRSLPSRTAWKA